MNLPTPTELTALAVAFSIAAGLIVWLMPTGLKLAIYCGIAAGACFLAAGVAHTYKQQGVTEQMAIDKPVIKAATDRIATAEKNTAQAETDLAALHAAYALQDAALASQVQATADAKHATAVLLAKLAAKDTFYTGKIAELQAQAAAPSTGDACHEADNILRDLANDPQRVRDP